MRIAMLGSRGVPATFGGVEHHVEELGSRLVERGHEVTVFCRRNYVDEPSRSYRGMRLEYLPTVATKHLEALVHTALSTIVSMKSRFDVIHYHAVGPGALAVLPRYLGGARVVLTVHGREVGRSKWGRGAKAGLRAASWLSVKVPHAVVAVSRTLTDYYQALGCPAVHIRNGIREMSPRPADQIIERFGLTPRSYALYVGRFVPEKGPDVAIAGFRQVDADLRLVLAGGTSYSNAYVDSLHQMAEGDRRVVFTGYVYGALLEELYTNAAVVVAPSRNEGLPLTLLEAVNLRTPVVASDIPPHVEVLGDEGPGRRLFPPESEEGFAAALDRAMEDPERERAGIALVRQRVAAEYSWEKAADDLEACYAELLRQPRRRALLPMRR